MTHTASDIRNARRFLSASGISKDGLDNDQIIARATTAGWTSNGQPQAPTAPTAPTAPQAPANDIGAAITAAIAAVMATQAQAPAVDEAAIIALIKEHATTTLKVQHQNGSVTTKTTTVTGAHKELDRIVKRLNAGYNVYLFGPAGAGKTTLAEQAAKSLDIPFSHTGALLQKYELTGFQDANGNYISTTFYEAYKHGHLYLFDEIDASNPMAVIAFNQAIENGQMTFPNEVVTRHPNFRCIAAANTNGNGATSSYKRNALDGATLDRFARIALSYDLKLELRLAMVEYKRLGGTDEQQAIDHVALVQHTRTQAIKKKIDVIISPRSSIRGCGILAMGDSTEMAIDECFGASLSTDQRKQLNLKAA